MRVTSQGAIQWNMNADDIFHTFAAKNIMFEQSETRNRLTMDSSHRVLAIADNT